MRPKKKNRFFRVTAWVLSILLLNLISLIVLAQLPYIQTRLAQSLSRYLSAETNFKINVDKVRIDWFDRVELDALSVYDEDSLKLLTVNTARINYNLGALLRKDLRLDDVAISGLDFRLQNHRSDTLNISVLLNRIKKLSTSSAKSSSPFRVGHISLGNSSFKYLVSEEPIDPSLFNYRNFNLTNIEAELSNLKIDSGTVLVEIISLATVDTGTNTKIQNLKTKFKISPTTMRLDSLHTRLGESDIHGSIIFDYSGFADLSDFNNKVRLNAVISKSSVSSKNLRLFSSYFKEINDTYLLSGNFKGLISDFRIRDLDLKLGQGSRLIGSLYFSGLPNIDETFIDINLKRSRLFENDLEQYILSEAFSKYNRFTEVKLNASFTGYIDDFVAYGNFDTNLGGITSDINLKIADNTTESSYSGKLALKEFKLGQYMDQEYLGVVSLNGKIEGSGMSLANTKFDFDGNVDEFELNDYRYTGISADGKFYNQYFIGSLSVDDPNLKLETQNEIDLRDNVQKIKISGDLAYAYPDKLNLTTTLTYLETKIEADVQGFNLDSISGYLYLDNLHAANEDKNLDINHFTLTSSMDQSSKLVELISEKANIKVTGNFSYQNLIRDMKYMLEEYRLNLLNNDDSLELFYASQDWLNSIDPYAVDLTASFANIDNFLELFAPDLSLHNATSLTASFKHSERNTLWAEIIVDSLSYQGNVALTNQINIDASKLIGASKILAAIDIQSKKQFLQGGSILEDFLFSAVWSDDFIDFNWYNTQPSIENINDVYGKITFYHDSTEIHLNRSLLTLLGKNWTIQDNNLVTLFNNKIKIQDLNIGSDDQMLTIAGMVGNDPEDILSVTMNNFDLGILNPLITKKLSGNVSGEFSVNNIYTTPTIVSNFYISDLYIDQFLIGNIFSSNDWNNEKNLFDIQFVVNRNNRPIILVNGIFNPFDSKNALDLNAAFLNAKLDIAEPFIATLFSKIKGNINGKLHISGALNAPIITGNGTLHGAGLNVNYLNTFYDVQGTWAFDSAAIYLNNLIVKDQDNNIGVVNGNFTHNGLKDFRINLNASMNNFRVLNTSARDNDLFYGTGIVTGTVSFIGPIENITIKASAKTERGTRFFIPIGGKNSTKFEDYITFVNFSDTTNINKTIVEEDLKITGLNLAFDLDITEDAYTEIIFDITSGDIIRGRGNGHVSLNIDTKGDFTMLGNYEFVSGGYNFTMYNIVNKEFEIKPKSKIIWSGDPYGGIMDIDASYKLTTSLAPLIDTVYHDLPDVKRIYPTEVLLGLKGPLLTPDIEFEILIEDYPKSNADLDTQIRAFLNTVALDQQELNRQVFSLLILRKFSPPNSFSSSGTIGSSVSEFVSNQLSYWISQVDDNLTIDMDLGELDADALKTFQLRVSYEFMDGKLIVTRDGGFTDPNNEASVESIAGDWTLEYLLSQDGKLRIKLFNKTNYNQLNSSTGSDSQALISGGFSLIYTTSFNKLGDLFKRKDKKEKKEKEIQESTSGLKPDENEEIRPK